MRSISPAGRISILLMFLPLLYCSSRFVKKEEIQRISKDYEKVYSLKERVEVGNFDSLNKGAKVKIYFKATGEYISIYAYPFSQVREEAVGKNILQLFDTDFPDKKFSEEVFRQKLSLLFEEYKGKLDKIPVDQGFGSDLTQGKQPPADGLKPSGKSGGRRGRRGK
ncbi:MAG TPA: type II secretion system-associated lipoprotein [Turneriella sp.]|nr:type II secretion system-associated lipoprotein [Turneriella sp.]HNJ66563.1 type II secretion system-associated lipoprotein [Turneriella sp.]